jgi:hypothetical protein
MEISTATRWEIREPPTLRFSVFTSDFKASLVETGAGIVEVGIAVPGVSIGPLAPLGLLRELANPLAFGAGSEVFAEAPGFRMDFTQPEAEPGLLCAPAPGTLGVYAVPLACGGENYGWYGRAAASSGDAVEGALSVSRPRTGAGGDDWYLSHAVFPGGTVLNAAARLVRRAGPESFVMTAGASAGERGMPDVFSHLLFSESGDGIDCAMLFGAAGPGYRTPKGSIPSEAALISGALSMYGTGLTVDASYDFAVGRGGFVPGSTIPTRHSFALTFNRRFPAAGKSAVTLEVAGKKTISWDDQGRREESARCAASLKARHGRLEAGGCVDCSQDGLGVTFTASARAGTRLRAGVEAAAHRIESEERSVSLLTSLHMSLRSGTLAVGAGVEKWPLMHTPADPWDCLTCTVTWSALSWVEPPGSP